MGWTQVAAVTGVTPSPTLGTGVEFDPPADVDEASRLILRTIERLWEGLLAHLPVIGLALLVFVVVVLLALVLAVATDHALQRAGTDRTVASLVTRLLRLAMMIGGALLALSIMGVRVRPLLAGFGLAGLALAFALQNILENFVAGVLLLVRKPFRGGDQIRSGEFEGTVEEIDLRVTHLIDYDGELLLIPNADVFRHPLVNLTRRGRRRTSVMVGVDYRDDHDRAREVIRGAVIGTYGVMENPTPEILLTQLGESSVDFEVRYWTLPDIRSVRHTQDRVLSAVKSALGEAGITIPWPIRTLVVDSPVDVRTTSSGQAS